MWKFILKRMCFLVLILIGVSIISFTILHLAPGNPARLMLPEGASDEAVAAMTKKLGLDKPLHVQYLVYMSGVVRGDLGNSLFYKQPNTKLISERLPATVLLTLSAVGLAILISLPLGIVAGVRRGSTTDFFAMFFALLGQSMSPVWLGILLIYLFSVKLQLLPPFGYGNLNNLIMPAITLGTPLAALITRLIRAGMIDVLNEDYILAIRSKGLSQNKVIFKYALKNVLIPVVTVVGIQIGTFLGGAIVTEKIFGWPGVGQLAVSAILSRDFPLVQAVILVVSFLFVFINMVVDIIYTVIDPRLKFE